ncbi:hypothetical protein [Nostoc sp. FACHB-892]|nr:hypothetical protein [Nostoc sp. FACHB-892]
MPKKHFRCMVAPVYKPPDILCPCQDRAIAVGTCRSKFVYMLCLY